MVNGPLLLALGPVFVIASLAMPAGIGGGLLYVPLCTFLGVTPDLREAAALAQPLIFGATLAAICYNLGWQMRHPGQVVMDPHLALAAVPPCLAGTMVGAMLNQLLPSLIIQILLFLVLGNSLRSAWIKGRTLWKKESLAKLAAKEEEEEKPGKEVDDDLTGSTPASPVAGESVESTHTPSDPKSKSPASLPPTEDPPYPSYCIFPEPVASEENIVRRRTIGGAELGQNTPPRSPVAASTLRSCPPAVAPPATSVGAPSMSCTTGTALPVAASVEDEDDDAFSDSKCGRCWTGKGTGKPLSNMQVWTGMAVVWGILVVCIVLRGGKSGPSVIGVHMCSEEYWIITAIGFAFLLASGAAARHPDIAVVRCFGVGVVSSIVGIGGGVLLNPMLLGMGLTPQMATATVTLMITMVSSNATINFLVAGAIPLVPTLALSSATFLGSLAGKSVVGWLIAKTGRNSILIFMLVGFMCISLLVAFIEAGEGLHSDIKDHINPFLKFENPCAA
mmetsp:Transcript_28742/g.61136  ORF Transcript_28742/g.61136 Transcript_28742/m.61136 type:complete len:505 (+) Transcript_28742:115-1629(+)